MYIAAVFIKLYNKGVGFRKFFNVITNYIREDNKK